jgi:hypothetical protein
MTGEGLACQSCHDRAALTLGEHRAELALKQAKAENPFGDGTFDPARRRRAMIWAFVIAGLLALTWLLKLVRVF